jgi:hypothetical protein
MGMRLNTLAGHFGKITRKLPPFLFVFLLLLSSSNAFANTVSFFIYSGPQRSATSLVDVNQTLANTYKYDAFGNVITLSNGISNNY